MKHLEGAAAPFSHFSLCLPRQRDDALLAQALAAFKSGQWLDALLAVECVCRSHPGKAIPLMLRARIVETCLPQQAARAWYLAWTCDPENPSLQDALLACWLRLGAAQQVRDLGRHFLPGRCQAGCEDNLVSLLAQAGADKLGVCWIECDAIAGRIFDFDRPVQTRSITLSDAEADSSFPIQVASRFVVDRPAAARVVSLAFDDGTLFHGSPLIFPAAPVVAPIAPIAPVLARLPRQHKAGAIDIVVPVYRGLPQVQACLRSVLHSLSLNRTPARLIVVDDASPEPALVAWLTELAQQGECVLLRNRHNLGFVEAANRGMRESAQHDVILLNADTEVHGDWIDRLRHSLYASDDIAASTAWSNNGEISSLLKAGVAASHPGAANLSALDQFAATLAPEWADVDLPACCGFVMMMRRSVLKQIGMLDGAGFYRGYGEEVDWCLRARTQGWRLVLAVRVFVAHAGGVSFGMEKVLRVRQNRAVLMARYPDYYPQYHRFLREDPLAAVRAALLGRASDNPWVTQHTSAAPASAGVLQAALESTCPRIAVLLPDSASPVAAAVLNLARLLASDPAGGLRILLLGQASEAMWHTGVVDLIPPPSGSTMLLTDAALIGLAGCVAVFAEGGQGRWGDLPCHAIDQDFDGSIWLAQYRDQQPETLPLQAPDQPPLQLARAKPPVGGKRRVAAKRGSTALNQPAGMVK